VLLRGLRMYGDPAAWDPTQPGWRAAASFLRCEKYPPSLHYLLMTLGPGLLVLAATERLRADGAWRWLVTLGRVPLFFYLLQWPMAHLLSRLFQWLDGQPIGWDGINPMHFRGLPPGCGFSLEVVWLAWALGLVVLVPACLWFARWRARHPDARWLRYL
jgi:peptidoglycan/LPS O-acetylase OafA/YrhL